MDWARLWTGLDCAFFFRGVIFFWGGRAGYIFSFDGRGKEGHTAFRGLD